LVAATSAILLWSPIVAAGSADLVARAAEAERSGDLDHAIGLYDRVIENADSKHVVLVQAMMRDRTPDD
jgi:hypothetical protein